MDSKDQKDAGKPRIYRAAAMLGRKLHALYIQLSEVYAFSVDEKRGEAYLEEEVLANTSYLAPELAQLNNLTNTVRLTSQSSIELPPGVTIIIGKSGSGKTKLAMAHMTVPNENVAYLRYGEPLDKRFVDAMMSVEQNGKVVASGMSLCNFEVDVANAIANFMVGDGTDVLIVDSLRSLFYSSGGATGKGGVNMSLFAQISFLDVIVGQRGKSLVLVINPLTDDQASYDAILEVAKGSVSALIDVKSPTSIRFTSRYEDRDYKSYQLPESAVVDRNTERLSAPSVSRASIGNIAR